MDNQWFVPIISKALQFTLNLIIFLFIIRWSIGQKKDLVFSDYFKVFLVAMLFYSIIYFLIYLAFGRWMLNDEETIKLII